MTRLRPFFIFLAALAPVASVAPVALAAPAAPAIEIAANPAGADTHCANLCAAPDGTLYLTYYGPAPAPTATTASPPVAPSAAAAAPALENLKSPIPDSPAARTLWLATLPPGATAWSAPLPVATTPLLLENWADFTSLVVGTDGALTAQWFQKPAPDARGYDGWYSRSEDGGRTWRTPARLGHEFVALAPLSQGRTLAVWLESTRGHAHAGPAATAKRDPAAPRPARDPAAPSAPAMKLLARLLAPDGTALRDWTVDPDVCTCCQNTAAVLPGDRVFVAYRGHTADEIRDNRSSIFDLAAGTWTAPAALRDDGWKIAACPVNGPAADARGSALAVAWFTAAGGTPRVYARSSSDAGRTFTDPVVVDLGKPMGRLETVALPDRSSAILWMELGTAENTAGIYARRLAPDGTLSPAHLLADTTRARASGFPRAALRPDGRIVMAWTQTGEKNRVATLAFDPALLLRPPVRTVSAGPAPALFRRGPPAVLEFCESPATVPVTAPGQ